MKEEREPQEAALDLIGEMGILKDQQIWSPNPEFINAPVQIEALAGHPRTVLDLTNPNS